jgi:hypothetical protein
VFKLPAFAAVRSPLHHEPPNQRLRLDSPSQSKTRHSYPGATRCNLADADHAAPLPLIRTGIDGHIPAATVGLGALKHASRRLAVKWHIEHRASGERRSSNGVRVAFRRRQLAVRPACRGYGGEPIEYAPPYQLKADTMLEFRSDGVHCRIAAVLPSEERAPLIFTCRLTVSARLRHAGNAQWRTRVPLTSGCVDVFLHAACTNAPRL